MGLHKRGTIVENKEQIQTKCYYQRSHKTYQFLITLLLHLQKIKSRLMNDKVLAVQGREFVSLHTQTRKILLSALS
jgi:hypothetical protein